jgi:hypothetical protein
MALPVLTEISVREFSDSTLLDVQRSLAQRRREIDAQSAVVAAEVAYRSRRDLGYEGLAQRMGARTPERLVQQVTGTSARDAATLIAVGGTPPGSPIRIAVAAGGLGLDAAAAIRRGLGDDAPDASVLALIASAAELSVEKLSARAREVRAELDAEGVLDREQLLRERRYLRLSATGDGMTRLVGLLDPESAAVVVAAYDGATSPRRGGPRFVDPEAAAASDELLGDSRSLEQIALDSLITLLQLGASAAPTGLPASHTFVRVLVAERDLARRDGSGELEGQPVALSIATVERRCCDATIEPVTIDSAGQVVDLGRTQRRFSARQRVGLSVRDGGCRFPRCDRPPSWCEAHHIVPWSHGGRTDLREGILLCRHHHLLVHNNGWQVTREGAEYWLIPPRSLDRAQQRIPAPTRSGVVLRVLADYAATVSSAGSSSNSEMPRAFSAVSTMVNPVMPGSFAMCESTSRMSLRPSEPPNRSPMT